VHLDVVVAESATVLKLPASEDKTLLVGRDALLVLNLGLDILNGVARLDVKNDALALKGLHEDFHGFLNTIIAPGKIYF